MAPAQLGRFRGSGHFQARSLAFIALANEERSVFLSPPLNPDSHVRPDGITKLHMVPLVGLPGPDTWPLMAPRTRIPGALLSRIQPCRVCPTLYFVLRGHETRIIQEENRIESFFAECRRKSFPCGHRCCAGMEEGTERASCRDTLAPLTHQRGASTSPRPGAHGEQS